MRVEVFITTAFKGKLNNGFGGYAMLARKEGREDTVDGYIRYIKGVSFPRLQAIACAEALEHLVNCTSVKLILQDIYAYNVIQSGKAEANADVWDRFFKCLDTYNDFEIERDVRHEYVDMSLERMGA